MATLWQAILGLSLYALSLVYDFEWCIVPLQAWCKLFATLHKRWI